MSAVLLNQKQAAQAAGCGVSQIVKLAKSGVLPDYKPRVDKESRHYPGFKEADIKRLKATGLLQPRVRREKVTKTTPESIHKLLAVIDQKLDRVLGYLEDK